MGNMLRYKGYHTNIKYDSEALVLRGKIEGINDLVTFESCDMGSIEKEFNNAVDEYLEFCEEVGKEPEKEYKGTFNVRINPTLHKALAILASNNDESLNATVEKAIRSYVNGISQTEITLNETITNLSQALVVQHVYGVNANNEQGYKGIVLDKQRYGNVKMSYQG